MVGHSDDCLGSVLDGGRYLRQVSRERLDGRPWNGEAANRLAANRSVVMSVARCLMRGVLGCDLYYSSVCRTHVERGMAGI